MDYIAEAITGQYGERCPEFAEGCATCEAWAQYDGIRNSALEEAAKACETTIFPDTSYPVDVSIVLTRMRVASNFASAIRRLKAEGESR